MFEHCVVSARSSSANTSNSSNGESGRLALADLYLGPMDVNYRCFKIYTRHGIPGPPFGSFPFVDAVITLQLSASTVGYFNYNIDRAHLWPAVRRPFCGLYPYVPRHSRRCARFFVFLLLVLLLVRSDVLLNVSNKSRINYCVVIILSCWQNDVVKAIVVGSFIVSVLPVSSDAVEPHVYSFVVALPTSNHFALVCLNQIGH